MALWGREWGRSREKCCLESGRYRLVRLKHSSRWEYLGLCLWFVSVACVLLVEKYLLSFCARKTSGKEVVENEEVSSLISRANGGPSTRVIWSFVLRYGPKTRA
jgi:hypothetical protein